MGKRTIGRHWPASAARGDYSAMCDVCGVPYRRSQLRRKPAGSLACPTCAKGRDVVELSRPVGPVPQVAPHRGGAPYPIDDDPPDVTLEELLEVWP